ncbi:MAG: tetratricopeptide repeat protein [Chitinophagaceae bacterium]
MRKIFVGMLSMLVLLSLSVPSISQKKSSEKTMPWTTKSKAAKDLASSGADHLMNAEFPQAYTDLLAAVKLDPNFTVALTLLSNQTTGETQKMYAQRALKTAADKTAGEKLFASLADAKMTQDSRREVWDKLHTMFPDGAMIGNFYVQTRATPEERFAAAQDYIKKFPTQPAMYNTIAYYYMQDKKDNDMAKQNFEKYISLYPKGSNPYDSMGEFYLNTGDTANARKYYNLSLEKYPFSTSSVNAIQKMADDKKKAEDDKKKTEIK